MSLSEIIDLLDDVDDEGDLPDNDNTTPLKDVGVPEEAGHYAESFYEVLGQIEEATIHHRDTFDNGSPDTPDDIVGLHNEFKSRDYQPAIAVGPVDGAPDKTTLYLVGQDDEAAPVDLVGEVATKQILENGNSEYIQFPVVSSMEEAQNMDLEFGQAVAVAGSTNDLFMQTE